MRRSIRTATMLAVLGTLVAASACGGQDGSAPEGGGPTATAPAAEPGGAAFDFPEIKALVERSGQATFTARYDVTAPAGPGASTVTLVRQAPVTVLVMDQVRLLWTPEDSYVCPETDAGEQCLRRGAPSDNEDPLTGPERDWAAMLADAGFDALSPVGAWQYLESLGGDGTEVLESSQTIAEQPSSCVEMINEAEALEWTGSVLACFMDNGVMSRYRLELSDSGESSQVTVELTSYSPAADPALVVVPTDAPLG